MSGNFSKVLKLPEREPDQSYPSNVEVTNKWNSTCLLQYAFILFTGTTLIYLYTYPFFSYLVSIVCVMWSLAVNNVFQ